MTTVQYQQLLELYKKAIENNLSAKEFAQKVLEANIEIDASFVKSGCEDENLGKYLTELLQLQKYEQS